MTVSNSFFAILKDDSIKRVILNQNIISQVKKIFEDASSELMPNDIEPIIFDGAFKVDKDEILYVEMALPVEIKNALNNPSNVHPLDIDKDEVKGLFWGVKNQGGITEVYVQNFDRRKLLNNKNVLIYSDKTYNNLVENGFIIDNKITAILKNDRLYFTSYHNAKRLFDLSMYFTEATDDDIDKFSDAQNISVDSDWLKENANTAIRKQITLALRNEYLSKTSAKGIQTEAKSYLPFSVKVENNKVEVPEDKKECKLFLEFLNEQIYKGIFS